MDINQRLDFIEFRQELLFSGTPVDRLLFEYKITKNQYEQIMDLMQKYRESIASGIDVHSGRFEEEIYKIVPELYGNYHFVESITQKFHKEGRWEEIFVKLYGQELKFQNYLNNKI